MADERGTVNDRRREGADMGENIGNVAVTVFGRGEDEQRALVVRPASHTQRVWLDAGDGPVEIDDWRFLPGAPGLEWSKPTLVGSTKPSGEVVVTTADGTAVASARYFDPAASNDADQPFQIMFGSCFSPRDDVPIDLTDLYDTVRDASAAPNALNVWLGDQVYVDAPWQEGWSAKEPLDVAALKYAENWGVSTDPERGLAGCMKKAANLYVPDDHEFWNGYPKPSLFTLPLQTMARMIQQGFRLLGSNSPHPAAQWKWASAMGRAYCVFQSDLRLDEFNTSVSPPQLQIHDVGETRILLLDQRWHRSIRRAGRGAGFMRDPDLDRALTTITAHEGLLVLGLARPMVGFMPPIGLQRKAEYGAEDYGSQYGRLWRALRERAELGRPTLALAGDVHRFGTQTALEDRFLEMCSSPLSLLDALDDDNLVTRVRRATAEMSRSRRRIAAAFAGEDEPEELPYPEVDADGSWRSRPGRQRTAVVHPEAGISGVTIDWSGSSGTVTLDTATVELRPWSSTEQKRSTFAWRSDRWTEA